MQKPEPERNYPASREQVETSYDQIAERYVAPTSTMAARVVALGTRPRGAQRGGTPPLGNTEHSLSIAVRNIWTKPTNESETAFDLHTSRYLGQAKTHVPHLLMAVAMNVVRLFQRGMGETLTKPHISHFAALAL